MTSNLILDSDRKLEDRKSPNGFLNKARSTKYINIFATATKSPTNFVTIKRDILTFKYS